MIKPLRVLPVLAFCLVFSLGGAVADEPEILPGEVKAEAMDSRDPSWVPLWTAFEDPESLECGARRACEDYKVVEVAEAEETKRVEEARQADEVEAAKGAEK